VALTLLTPSMGRMHNCKLGINHKL
jgi:hypothetical protein